MAHHADARFSVDDSLMLPPMRTIGFNPQLNLNDSLLAQSYIDVHDISYPEAMRRIDSDVANIKEQLRQNGSYEFNDIGTLSLTEDGLYDFQPCEAGLLTPEYYGLSSIEAKRRDLMPKAIVIPMSVLRNVAAACILIMVMFLMPAPSNDGSIKHTTATSMIDTNRLTEIMPKDITTGSPSIKVVKASEPKQHVSAVKKVQPQAAKQQEAPVKTQAENVQKATAKAQPTHYYTIVLASHVTEHNAADYVNTLHAKGYTSAAVHNGKSSRKVIYGTYASQSEAYNALNKLNDKTEFAQAWVLKI